MRIEQVLGLRESTRVRVSGFVLACEGEPMRLCTELLESYPPQCGGPSLVVEGLDVASLPGITRSDDCAWSARPVELDGMVADGILRVASAEPSK